MLQRAALIATTLALSATSAFAVVAPAAEEEEGFPIAIVFALIAVAMSVFVVFMSAARRNQKKD